MIASPDKAAGFLTADLVYDTKTQALATGIRAAMQRSRRLLYAVDEMELVFQVTPAGQQQRVRLFGQILDDGVPVEGAAVSLRGPSTAFDGETDEDGEFKVADLHVGRYDLDVATESGLIRVTNMDVA
jgi:hypothetical protein